MDLNTTKKSNILENESFLDNIDKTSLKKDSECTSSYDELQYMIEEALLLSQRNHHYCNHTLIKNFRRIVRTDNAELFFSKNMSLKDITCEKQCRDQVNELINLVDQKLYPEYIKFHNEVVQPVKTMSRRKNHQLIKVQQTKNTSFFAEFEDLELNSEDVISKKRSNSKSN